MNPKQYFSPFWKVILSNFLRIIGVTALFVLGIFAGRSCSNTAKTKCNITYTDTTTVTVYDSSSQLVGKEDLKVSSTFVAAPSLPPIIDSLEIVLAYFGTNSITTTYRDENVAIKTGFDITEKQLQNQQWEYKILRPSSITTIANDYRPTPPVFQLYAGASINHNPFYTSVSPELDVLIRNRHLFGAGTDLMIPQPNFNIRYAVRLFKIQGK